jgi:hypothetical protein
MINKFLIFAFLLLFPIKANVETTNTTQYTILQINAKWNKKNDVDIPRVPGCTIQYAFLEDQSPSFRKNVTHVPVVVVYKKNRAIHQWTADLTFKLTVSKEEILEVIKHEENR